jgi:hypothetical protein
MIVSVALTICLLALPLALPTLLLVGLSLDVLFLLPLTGALVAALSTFLELAVGGTMFGWFIALCVFANILAIVVLARRRRLGIDLGLRPALTVQSAVQFLVIAAAVAWPLQALASRDLGYDTNAFWLVRAIEVYGGHGLLFTAIHAPTLVTANADYPPLVPAGTATGFFVRGQVVYDMGAAVPAVLNSCALGVLASGLIRVARQRSSLGAWPGTVLGAAVALIGFGLAGPYGIDGYADLLWSASAVAAVVYGLVLPSTIRHLAVAWICATVAALTKNEGLTMALVILFLSAVRFVPTPARTEKPEDHRARRVAVTWLQRLVLAAVMALPGLSWAVLVRSYGVQDSFFADGLRLSPRGRFGPTVSAMWAQLHLLPFVALIALAGVLVLRQRRRRIGLGHEAWLWACLCASLAITVGTYVFGDYPLSWWLATSVDRTTLFAALLLYTDLAIWMCVAGGELASRRSRTAEAQPHRADPPEAEVVARSATPIPSLGTSLMPSG